jgi:hypothetical protein
MQVAYIASAEFALSLSSPPHLRLNLLNASSLKTLCEPSPIYFMVHSAHDYSDR